MKWVKPNYLLRLTYIVTFTVSSISIKSSTMSHAVKKNNKLADKLRELGNESYSKGETFDALLKFNESLCFAEVGTLSVGLAYANRSAAYLRLRRYENCLRNIQLARDCGYPEEKLIKLSQREEKCREAIGLEGNERSKTPWDFSNSHTSQTRRFPFSPTA